ncbi:GDSL-type esterase/lipase family protein [Tenacibaculum sp. SG-28]|uniref:GDSL-type esterase/lipase family protein n=1 Tax=Tenacibaculum sp. SG-28 TaxID=754426 RepID=UPI000CF4E11B|nr:GDSL-type esterase/lipase family protein [Tenacibaculum sp. SG-28]PQJ20805.1 hypothetical protein BSU00_11070 [Tenacibaculum sp. SG-28]
MNKKRLVAVLLFFIVQFTFSQNSISIFPDNDAILYSGRFSFENPLTPSFSMSATSIKFNFSGTEVNGFFSSEGSSYLYVIIDGKANPYNRKVIKVSTTSKKPFLLADKLPYGEHTLEIVKLNESDTKVYFYGIEIKGKGIGKKPKRAPVKLEFIGDSNTAGWSAWNAYDKGKNAASESYFTFPGITARALNAEYSLIGASGSGITNYSSWNLTKNYDQIHLKDSISAKNTWDFTSNYWNFIPDAVIINLGANDHYPKAPKDSIKSNWKRFITAKLRKHYPKSHIVLANSYGWSFDEPTDYIHEVIAELKASGDTNVSFVKFPWLWGQEHAVISEHAGFANILAPHLATVLGLPKPIPSALSSIAEKETLYNGDFEKNILPNIPDGWRPHKEVTLVKNTSSAYSGTSFLQVKNGGWAHAPVQVEEGKVLQVNGFLKSSQTSLPKENAIFKIVFKDQGQTTIATTKGLSNVHTSWTPFSIKAMVPEGAWSAWIVLESGKDTVVDFDAIRIQQVLEEN